MKFNIDSFRNSSIPSEQEITESWENEFPVVSIICTTYNQENYIEDAITGFLIQKTNFPFEIIIHDDASTDKTVKIITDYKKRYPKLITTILQKENQYSKAPNSVFLISSKHAKGKYFALCEGDDFWIDNKKLQTQKDAIESNSKYSIITHNAYKLYSDGLSISFSEKIGRYEFHPSDILKKNRQFAPTASYFFKAQIINHLPNWFNQAPIGDLFIELYSSIIGCGFSLPEKYCIYRVNSENSWSSRTSASSEIKSNVIRQLIECLHKTCQDLPDYKIFIKRRIFELHRLLAIEKFIHTSEKDKLSKNLKKEYEIFRCEIYNLQVINLLIFNLTFPPSFKLFVIHNKTKIRTRILLVNVYKYFRRSLQKI